MFKITRKVCQSVRIFIGFRGESLSESKTLNEEGIQMKKLGLLGLAILLSTATQSFAIKTDPVLSPSPREISGAAITTYDGCVVKYLLKILMP